MTSTRGVLLCTYILAVFAQGYFAVSFLMTIAAEKSDPIDLAGFSTAHSDKLPTIFIFDSIEPTAGPLPKTLTH